MDLKTFFLFKNSFFFLIISIIIINLMAEALSLDSNISSCIPQNCGNGQNISYPFWIPHKQESYCGSPGFNIACNDNNPILTISGDDYIIEEISYANNSFLLANTYVYDEDNACPTPIHNFSIEGTPFSYGPASAHLYFFYNCTYPDAYATYSVDCASNTSSHSFAVFHVELLTQRNYSIESCIGPVNAPVEAEDLKRLLLMNFTDILKTGFVLVWSGDNCSNCETSGGRCGSLNNEFTCFCHDQPHLRTCSNTGRKLDWRSKLGIGFGAAGGSIFIMGIIFCIYHRRTKKRYGGSYLISRNISSYPSSMTDFEKAGTYLGVHIFDYKELEKATNKFDSKQTLGDGGFGMVYQGKLKDGRVVAVKRLYENNYKRVEQFVNEVEILAGLRHQNLVSLYGCTTHHCHELLLVYEYVPNGTVADHLHGERAKPGALTWATRLNIAVETANALVYLHASDIIHRDVKTNNILLDKNFGVKVADFGLSRLFPTDVSHVSTAPQGTPGYVDPEYHECYQLTDKSDVFSFGVVLVELISSKPAVDICRHRHEINLSNMAINKIRTNTLHEFVDPNLGFESDYKIRKTVKSVAELAFQCLQNERDMRPSMEEVLEELKSIQSKNFIIENEDGVIVTKDDVVMLKNNPEILSPDSVAVKWLSSSTISNASSG